MIAFLMRLFKREAPLFSEAGPADAQRFAQLHASLFRRGWSEDEMERLLLDRRVLAHRVTIGERLAGFILSRCAADEAEILSVAVDRRLQGRGLARRLLDLHIRRLAGMGVRKLFLEVEEGNKPARRLYHRAGFREAGRRPGYYPRSEGAAAALVLQRDLG
jgi:ribosomal-protein-alanine N-acetyltransferase